MLRIKNTEKATLHYPLAKITLNKVDKPYNIIMLVAESLRDKDIFTEQVMPYSTAFAKQHDTRFQQHYSGGNGTRQGLFALFYGLYGIYWDPFLAARRGPVLLYVLHEYNYQYFLYTGARFTYPEFNQTIFSTIPVAQLIETSSGEPWVRDAKNIDLLLDRIDKRDTSKPFMSFVFLNRRTHAIRSLKIVLLKKTTYQP